MASEGIEAARRRALVAATIEAIHDSGLKQVTVAQIAARAGVSAPLAHHYFGTKEKLIAAAMRRLLSDLGEEIQARLARAETPRARISAIVSANFAPAQLRPACISAWLALYAAAQNDPQARRLLAIYRRRTQSNLLHALRGLAAGDEAKRLAEIVAALIDGLWIRRALDDAARLEDAARLVERTIDAVLADGARGISPRP